MSILFYGIQKNKNPFLESLSILKSIISCKFNSFKYGLSSHRSDLIEGSKRITSKYPVIEVRESKSKYLRSQLIKDLPAILVL
jgi:hypothetical protein